ncbi:MAG: APC family permease [Flavobacteriaceae bacterium]|nr:APC family permease [Flavobacteriaceae bacterium]
MSKKLGKKEIFTVALGSVIGWGAFVLPGNIFLREYGIINTALGFLIAVFMLFFIEKSYSTVMEKVPKSGGEYSFAKELLNKKIAFITGWGLLLAYLSLIPLNAIAVPMVLDKVFPFYSKGLLLYSIAGYDVFSNDVIISCFIILFFIFIHLRGLKSIALAQNISVFSLLFSLLIIVLFMTGNIGEVEKQNLVSNLGEVNRNSIIRIIAFAPWAFIGFDTVAQLSADHKLSAKKVSKITLFAIIIGALIYNGLNVITALGINKSNFGDVSWQTGEAVERLVGSGLFYLLVVAMFGAVISGLNGFFIASSRLLVSMGEDYGLNTETNTDSIIPKWIVIFIGVCSLIVPFMGRNALLWFVDLSSVGSSVAYLFTSICAYKIASTNKNRLISIISMSVSIVFLIFLLTPFFSSNISQASYYCLFFWVLFGVLVYSKIRKYH